MMMYNQKVEKVKDKQDDPEDTARHSTILVRWFTQQKKGDQVVPLRTCIVGERARGHRGQLRPKGHSFRHHVDYDESRVNIFRMDGTRR
jgi:hypothetical protein